MRIRARGVAPPYGPLARRAAVLAWPAARRSWLRISAPGAAAPLAVLAIVCILAGALHLWLTRGTWFYGEELAWAAQYEGLGSKVWTVWVGWFDPLLRLTYNAVFATVGLESYLPLRVLAALFNVTLALAVFWYCRDIGRPWSGAALGAFLLVFGSALHTLLFPLNSVIALAMATLPACLVLVRRNRRSGDLWALAVLLVGVSFAGPSVVPVCAAIATWLLLGKPRGWRRLWLPAVPLAILAFTTALLPTASPLGRLAYNRGGITYLENLLAAPRYVYGAASAIASSVAGLYKYSGITSDYGPTLLALAALALGVRLPRLAPDRRRRVLT